MFTCIKCNQEADESVLLCSSCRTHGKSIITGREFADALQSDCSNLSNLSNVLFDISVAFSGFSLSFRVRAINSECLSLSGDPTVTYRDFTDSFGSRVLEIDQTIKVQEL